MDGYRFLGRLDPPDCAFVLRLMRGGLANIDLSDQTDGELARLVAHFQGADELPDEDEVRGPVLFLRERACRVLEVRERFRNLVGEALDDGA